MLDSGPGTVGAGSMGIGGSKGGLVPSAAPLALQTPNSSADESNSRHPCQERPDGLSLRVCKTQYCPILFSIFSRGGGVNRPSHVKMNQKAQ